MNRPLVLTSVALGIVAVTTSGIIYANTTKETKTAQTENSPIPTIEQQPTPTASPSATPKPTKKSTITTTPTPKPTSTPSNNSNSSNNSNESNTSTTPTSTPQSTVNSTPTPTPKPTNTTTSGTVSVSSTNVISTIDAGGASEGLFYGSGLTITSEGANGIAFKINGGTQGQGFDVSSMGMIPGTSKTVRTYINASKGNGTYKGSVTLMYSKNGQNFDGPTINYEITLVNTADRSGTLEVSTNTVNTTISRNGSPAGHILQGSGFTITGRGASTFVLIYTEPTSGRGFDVASGGLGNGTTINIPTYINTNYPNGTYTGGVIVKYTKDGVESSGPTVTYSITLTD